MRQLSSSWSRRAYQLTTLTLRSLAGALPAAVGLVIGDGAGYLLWPRLLPEASALVVLPFAVFGAVAGWLAFRIPLPKPVTHGSARFRSRRELDAFRGPDGLIVGRAAQPDYFLLRYAGPGHLLTIAPTRAGKGVGAILPNLLLADRPVIVIDPKGENYRVAARARNRFGPVWALDPFGVTGNESAAYNPLDLLDPGSERFAEDAAALADAIVSDPPGEVREAHWNEEAVALLSGLILLCASSEPPARRNLARVRAYLTQPPETFHQLLETM